MADNSGLIKIALFGGAAYLAYKQGWLSFLGLGTSTPAPAAAAAPPAAATPPATGPVSTPPVAQPQITPTVNSLDTIYSKMTAAAAAAGEASLLGVDTWGYYLNQQLAPMGKSAPDPGPLMTDAFGGWWTRASPMAASNYWAVMAPALKSQLGLSGLGIYGGMGALTLMRRRR